MVTCRLPGEKDVRLSRPDESSPRRRQFINLLPVRYFKEKCLLILSGINLLSNMPLLIQWQSKWRKECRSLWTWPSVPLSLHFRGRFLQLLVNSLRSQIMLFHELFGKVLFDGKCCSKDAVRSLARRKDFWGGNGWTVLLLFFLPLKYHNEYVFFVSNYVLAWMLLAFLANLVLLESFFDLITFQPIEKKRKN